MQTAGSQKVDLAKCHLYIVNVAGLTTHIACKALVASFPGSPRARTKFRTASDGKLGGAWAGSEGKALVYWFDPETHFCTKMLLAA